MLFKVGIYIIIIFGIDLEFDFSHWDLSLHSLAASTCLEDVIGITTFTPSCKIRIIHMLAIHTSMRAGIRLCANTQSRQHLCPLTQTQCSGQTIACIFEERYEISR